MDTWVKICGLTTAQDAELVVRAGASALGLNFVPSSKRKVTVERALSIVNHVRGQGLAVSFIGVFANQAQAEVLDTARRLSLDGIQLHGDESPEELDSYLAAGSAAFKAVRIGARSDVDLARTYGGHLLLVDAKVGGELGGTGHVFDWSLITDLVRERRVVLAGGLRPDNVHAAVAQVNPYGVDTASGVEVAPGIKDEALLRQFIAQATTAGVAPQLRSVTRS